MGVPKRLTEMQKRFAEYIVFNEGRTTGADAAIAAGYSEKRARVEASELQNPRLSPLVVQYIGALREEKLKKYEVTYDKHVAELGKIREEALKKGAFSAATNAEKNRGMAAGLYIDRKIIKTGKLRLPRNQSQKIKHRNKKYNHNQNKYPVTTTHYLFFFLVFFFLTFTFFFFFLGFISLS